MDVLTIIFFFASLLVFVFYFLTYGQPEEQPSPYCNCLETCDQMTSFGHTSGSCSSDEDYTTNACKPCMKRDMWCEEWEETPVEVLLVFAEWEEVCSKLCEELDTDLKTEDFIHASHLKGQIKIFAEIVNVIRSKDFARASMFKTKCDRGPFKSIDHSK